MATASASSVPSSCIKTTSMFQIVQFPCLGDNYGYLLHDGSTGETAAIDTPESKVYMEELEKRNWKLTHIFKYVTILESYCYAICFHKPSSFI